MAIKKYTLKHAYKEQMKSLLLEFVVL